MKYCPTCGVQNPQESKFCKSCGFYFIPVELKGLKPENPLKNTKTYETVPSKKKRQLKISKKSKRVGGIILIVLLLGTCSLIFNKQIAGIFNSSEGEKTDSLISIVPLQIPVVQSEKITQETIEPTGKNEINLQEKQTHTTVKQEIDPVSSPQKYVKSKQAAKAPVFNGLKEYFDYLGNPENSYSEKASVQRQMIKDNFSGNNFMVTVQTANGVKTDKITINDLADEIRLNNSKIVIRTLKINKTNNIVTEMAISYK